MQQLFFAGKAYLKINSLVKTPLHEFMAVERSELWAPAKGGKNNIFEKSQKNSVDYPRHSRNENINFSFIE